MTKAFDLTSEPEFVPQLKMDDIHEAIRVMRIRARFSAMLESPSQFSASLFKEQNKQHLIHALEQSTIEDIADFILVAIDMLEGELNSAQSDADELESELDIAEERIKTLEARLKV